MFIYSFCIYNIREYLCSIQVHGRYCSSTSRYLYRIYRPGLFILSQLWPIVGLGVWANFSFGGTHDESGVSIPLNASYIYGTNHKFELGIGITYAPGINIRQLPDLSISGIIGYRYQSVDGSFLVRVVYVHFLSDEGIITSAGIGLGIAFWFSMILFGINIYRLRDVNFIRTKMTVLMK